MRRNFYFLLLLGFIITIAFTALNAFLPITGAALAQNFSSAISIPTLTYVEAEQEVLAPDWSKITFGNLPPIEEPGWIKIPAQFVNQLGYDPSRIWFSGDRPNQILKLGDIAQAFHPEVFRLSDITDLTGLAIKTLNLKDFGLTDWQSPSSLVKAIPGLGELPISKVQPIYDLVSQLGNKAALNTKIADIARDQVLGKIPLGKYLDLRKYSLDSIPGLSKTPLGKFSGWQQSFINQVPGLSEVPFSQMPQPLAIANIRLAYHDLTWSSAETGDPQAPVSLTLSGSVNKKGKVVPVPCLAGKPCSYVELADPLGANGSMYGKRWISGKVQKVKGGFGPLRVLNGGWEPTGLLVYGSAFKVVLLDTNESLGTASYSLYFRACASVPLYGRSCSPYFIGPVPWLTSKEKGVIIVASTANPKVDIPSKYKDQIAQIRSAYEPQGTTISTDSVNQASSNNGTLCGRGPGGVDLKALGDATSSIEGNYNSIGKWGCDSAGNCGRGLGRYQLMTYRSDVKQAIQSQAGGREFYARLASGYSLSTAEINQYFSPAVQDKLFVRAQTDNINYLRKRGASGDGLIACLGQMWYSGRCSNSNGRDYIGGPTIRQYGQKLVDSYRKATANGTSSCPVASASGSGTATGKLTNPSPGAPITSEFGRRDSPCKGCSSDHKGIDIAIGNGTSVKASDGGTVVYAGTAKGYGNVLVIDHGNGLQTRYAHLEGFSVKPGTKVASGQAVAISDSTGVGTGAHLHFEVRENSSLNKSPFDPSVKAANPRKYVKFSP